MKNRLETRVGLFFVLAALAAVLMLEVSDNFGFFRKTYVLYADYNNVNELKVGDPVKLAGVQIGRVESIALGGGESKPVRVTLRIGVAHQDRIKSDSVATIKFTGLMGQNFVSIHPGLDSVVMDPGSLLKSQEMADLNTMLATMNNVAGGIEAVTDSFKGVKIDSIVGPMAKFLQANTNRMYNIVESMETISGQLANGKGVAGKLLNDEQLYNSLSTTVANMEKISEIVAKGEGTIGKLMTEDALHQQLDTIAKDFGQVSADLKLVSEKIAKGEGTIGKLVHDDKLYALLNTTANDFSKVGTDLKSVTDKVAKGEGTVGKLLHEDEFYNSLNATAKSLENSSAKVDKLVDNTNKLVTDARSTVDTVSEAATAAKSVLTKVDEGEGTLGKLVNQDVLYAETTEAMKNLREIVQKINRGEGTVGMLVNDDSLFKSARATLQKVDNATETMEDQGPVSVIGLMFNGLF
jgi:phospholipid/cholesterol/gamma-HCH transport system substrate-binding protein